MEDFSDKDYREFLEFIAKGIETNDPEVVVSFSVSDHSSMSVNSAPSNQEIRVNDELPNLSHGLDMATDAPNNQHLLKSNLSQSSRGFEIGKQNSQISICDNNVSNVNHDITMQTKLSNTQETFITPVACLSQAYRKTEQAFVMNSKLGNGFQEFHMSGSANHLLPSDLLMANTVPAHDRMRNVSHDRMITLNSQARKRSRHKSFEKRSQVLPTCSEDDGMNYASQTDMRSTESQMVLENSRLAGNHYEYSNIKEPHFYNQGIQENRNLSTNIRQNYPSNVYILQSPHNANAPCENPYCGGIAVDDILAVPGPSEIFQNTNESNLSEEKFHPMSPLEHNSADVDKKTLFCKFCKKEIAKHGGAHQGKNIYECCKCMYKSEVMHDLQMHIRVYNYARVGHYYCNVCREVYTGKGSHDVERECKVCGKSFLCKGLLEQHSEEHKIHFDSYCRLCGTVIDKHISEDAQKTVYECCECDYVNTGRCHIQDHLSKHSDLQLFKCYVCGRRYKYKQVLQNHLTKHEKEDSTT